VQDSRHHHAVDGHQDRRSTQVSDFVYTIFIFFTFFCLHSIRKHVQRISFDRLFRRTEVWWNCTNKTVINDLFVEIMYLTPFVYIRRTTIIVDIIIIVILRTRLVAPRAAAVVLAGFLNGINHCTFMVNGNKRDWYVHINHSDHCFFFFVVCRTYIYIYIKIKVWTSIIICYD